MRKRDLSMSKRQNKGKNKRLALIKPYELSKIVESLVNKQNKTLIKVDSYKTSQVEYGTAYEEKHVKLRDYPKLKANNLVEII